MIITHMVVQVSVNLIVWHLPAGYMKTVITIWWNMTGAVLGVKPQSNFENAYLFAAGTAKGCGSIDTSGLVLTQQKQGEA